ncbi:hypothetical protein ABAC460_01290 [Asticcacaulis sp. AC460]|uniref:YciI family protein n=1 Tax=Asticcacaulis sp. AC460 TaxID=1282360 RepID=UPI0003C3E907|nr:YciI family protein [Asticcacaulis sp. AC460]ESQ92909.1 hypothetical protein ABAC460_01290 [Asticcacaulis sp. AC460]
MQYHCLVYFDPKLAFNGSPESNAVMADIGPHTAELKASGHLISHFPLNMPSEAITVTTRDGKMSTTDGPFIETREMLGGLVVIEARDLNEALRIAGDMPHARLGHIEVRPAIDFTKPRPKL